jgi:hypothetical protein
VVKFPKKCFSKKFDKFDLNEGNLVRKHKVLLLYFYELENLRRLLAKEKITCNFTLFPQKCIFPSSSQKNISKSNKKLLTKGGKKKYK